MRNWREKLNIREVLSDLGWAWEKEENRQEEVWLVGKCPIHHGHARFDVRTSNGYWKCWSECGEGNIEELYGILAQCTATAATQILKDQAGVKAKEAVAPLPTAENLTAWEIGLTRSDLGLKYLESHGISRQVAADYSLGVDGSNLFCIPIFDKKCELANVKRFNLEATKTKKGLYGRRQFTYPWPHIHNWDPNKPIVICEGEPDALALLSIEQNVCTTTGGVQKLKDHIPWDLIPAEATLVVALDNDEPGKKAASGLVKRIKAKRPDCTIRRVSIPEPHNDVADYLTSMDPIVRRDEWENLADSSFTVNSQSFEHRGIFESGGEMFAKTAFEEELIAPFTGHILESGPVVEDGMEKGRGYKLKLVHGTLNSVLEMDYLPIRGPFNEAIQNAPNGGPEWNILKKDADKIFDYICRKTTRTGGKGYRKIGYGWLFGYRDRNLNSFYTQSTVFRDRGPANNEEIKMEPTGEFFDRMDLPVPDAGKARNGMRLMWEYATLCHDEHVMYPLLLAAMIAPVRRLLSPSDPPFLLFLRGQTQACKTTRAKVAQCFYGDYWNEQTLMTFQGTIKYLEASIARCGDALAVIDELDYGKMSETEKRDAKRWLQGTAQGFGRGRMDKDGGIKMSSAAHAIRVITCEQLPEGDQSLIGRGLVVDVPRIDPLDPGYLKPHTEVEMNRDLLPHVTAAWIDEVMRSPERWTERYNAEFLSSGQNFTELAEDCYGPMWREIPQMSRTYNRLRMFTTYAKVFLQFCREYNGIGLQTYEHCLKTWNRPVLRSLMQSQVDAVSSGGAMFNIMVGLESAISSGDAQFLVGKNERVPTFAKQNASIVGLITPVAGRMTTTPEYKKCSIQIRGENQVVAITPGIQSLWQNDKSWTQVRRYLIDGEIASEVGSGRLKGQRALVLRQEQARMIAGLLGVMDPMLRRDNSSESVSDTRASSSD